jgi:hypothetical protein
MAEDNDDLRATLTAAFAGEGKPAPEAPVADMGENEPDPITGAQAQIDNSEPSAPVETQEQKDQRARDEQGRFVAKPAEAKPVEAPKPIEGKPVTTAQPTPQAERVAPPLEWNGNAKVRWEKLPRDIQEQISKDYVGIGQLKQAFTGIAQVIGPRAQELTNQYGSPEAAIGQLFQLSDYAARDPEGFVRHFCKVRGIDPSRFGQPMDGQQPQAEAHPVVNQLLGKINQLESQLQSFAGQQSQAEQSALSSQIQEFASSPDAPYFNDVRHDMAALIESGRAKTLKDAYDMAVWANPQTRASLLQAQQEKAMTDQRSKAEAARKAASANLTGSPIPGYSGSEPPDSVRGAIMQAVQQHGGRL